MIDLLFTLALTAPPDPIQQYRNQLGDQVYTFVNEHAVCEEDSGEREVCVWDYDGAYQLFHTADQLKNPKVNLKDIVMPVSDWNRGGYAPYLDPITYVTHEWLKLSIWVMINYGVAGIPVQVNP